MHYISINIYGNSQDSGFVNTWESYICRDRNHQKSLLDYNFPCVRLSTQDEIKRLKKQINYEEHIAPEKLAITDSGKLHFLY